MLILTTVSLPLIFLDDSREKKKNDAEIEIENEEMIKKWII